MLTDAGMGRISSPSTMTVASTVHIPVAVIRTADAIPQPHLGRMDLILYSSSDAAESASPSRRIGVTRLSNAKGGMLVRRSVDIGQRETANYRIRTTATTARTQGYIPLAMNEPKWC